MQPSSRRRAGRIALKNLKLANASALENQALRSQNVIVNLKLGIKGQGQT